MLRLLLFAGAVLLLTYLLTRLRHARFSQYAHIPQVPNHLIWGHLKIFGELSRRGVPADRHTDAIFEDMRASIGRPSVMFVDLRPVNPPMILVATHDVAEQISKPSKAHAFSVPKSPSLAQMTPMIGAETILRKEGPDWKDVRKRYNPGFTSQNISDLLTTVLDKMDPFCNFLSAFAVTGQEFSLEMLLSNLTFDIIGIVVMDVDLDAQHMNSARQGEIIRLYRELLQTFHGDQSNTPWFLVPLLTLKRQRLAKRVDTLVKKAIERRYLEATKADKENGRSILALSFKEAGELTPQLLADTSAQVRTFMFAGHDTTATTLEWAFYELSRTPRALKAVRDELDSILGPESDPRMIRGILADKGAQVLSRMTYINAVVKETLRLHPPAATARMAPPGSGFTVKVPTGEEYVVDGCILYCCQSIIHRDPNVYGDTADDWVPERWLGEAASSIPPSAWRPFERGPRNCVGLELANLEARVIIAIVARRYDFVKTGLGASVLDEKGRPMLNEKGQYRVKSELYNTLRLTSKPADGTMMKIKLAAES
ncbi:cytochrome P450 [Astrocystis sublimbata]|nr:cytochrome P450 [Astrocystis sublimbata]